MLQVFRKYGNSITVKALMLLLVLTFAIWGVGDVIRGHNRFIALQVGEIEFSEQQWVAYFNNQLERIKMQFNAKISKEEVKKLGLHNMLLGQLIDKLLLQQEAKNNGILVSNDMVKYELLHMPMFQVDGKFDKTRFQQVLQSLRLSEQHLLDSVKDEMPAQYESFAITTNRMPSEDLVDVVLEAKGANRQVNIYSLPYDAIKIAAAPTEDELHSIYKKNAQAFEIKEKRNISYVVFGMDDIKITESVTDEQLQQFYDQNKERFKELEKRSVLKLEFKDKEKAEEAEAMLNKGESFENVAKKFFPNKQNFSIGDVTNVGFEKEIADAIFSLKLGQHSNIVKTPLGHLIFKVTAIIPEGIKPLSAIKDKIKTLYISEFRYEKLNHISQDIDQMLASGKTVRDVSSAYGFKVNTLIGVDNKSTGQLLNDEEFKQAVFATLENNTSMVGTLRSQDKFFVLQVDKVVPSSTKDFNIVKNELEKTWYEEKKEEKIMVAARELSESVKAKGNIADILAKYGFAKAQSLKMSYYNADDIKQPKEFITAILQLKKNEVSDPFKDAKGYLVAHVVSVEGVDVAKFQDKRKEIVDEYAANMPDEIRSQYLLALKSKYKIEINRSVIDRVLE